ncbi:MAG: thioredoxin [Deltaproteobacteria bacterium]|nr:thioredoxin [Deltaproteobacteria bacterium]
MSSPKIKTATDQNFEKEVLQGQRPALVDFWAVWCAPCRALAPIVDEIADQYDGKVDVYKCNVDENPETPGRYGVRGIPTIILFKGGQAVDQVVGAVPKAQLEELIKRVVV